MSSKSSRILAVETPSTAPPPSTVPAGHLVIDPPLVVKCPKPTMELRYAVISFISPEDMIKARFMYDAGKFLFHDVNKQLVDTTINIARNVNTEFDRQISQKIDMYRKSTDEQYHLIADLLEQLRKELKLNEDTQVTKTLRQYQIDQQELLDRFEVYRTSNEKELEGEFNQTHQSRTSVRGVKVRGAFEDLGEARERAKMLRNEVEKNIHAYVLPVGYWCPFDPNPDGVQDQDHMIPELNEMMDQYNRNVEQRNEHFARRKQMMIDGANESSMRERLRNRALGAPPETPKK